jgi:hypothetical protein
LARSLHVFVGLGAPAEIVVAPGQDHFSILTSDGGMLEREVREMTRTYASVR